MRKLNVSNRTQVALLARRLALDPALETADYVG
jgi:DNA-binding NarL/FixJ family response regulator